MKPIRVLQVLYRADRGGAETWLVHLAKHIDRNEVAMDFLVHDSTPGAYDSEIRAKGAQIFPSIRHHNIFRQWYFLWNCNRRFGPYDIVHSHVDYYGGFVVLYSWLVGIRGRVVNFHADHRVENTAAPERRRLYTSLMRWCVGVFATAGLGVSSNAAASLFGENWRSDRRWRVHPAAVDLQAFEEHPNRAEVRKQLGIPAHAIVIGHVGRFVEEKNHQFVVRLAGCFAKRRDVRFLLIGDGPLKAEIEREVRERGLDDRFILLPPREDVPRLMLGAMDMFIFPSRSEGLGLALLEAQAAGLQCLVSDAVPSEAIAVPELVQQLPISAGPKLWAETIVECMKTPPPIMQEIACKRVEQVFDIKRNAEQLVQFYQAVAS